MKRCAIRGTVMELLWWLIAIVLMAVGLLGTVLPVVPGAIIILAAAILHQIMLGPRKVSAGGTSPRWSC